MAFQEYSLASGFDQSGSLVNIEVSPFPSFQGFNAQTAGLGSFNPGIVQVKADRLTIARGYQSRVWTFSVMPFVTYDYLRTTFTVGGDSYSGKVTVRTTTVPETYVNWNAYMYLPTEGELTRTATAFVNVVITFSFEAIAA